MSKSMIPFKMDLKEFGKSSGQIGAGFGGFSLGHLAFNNVVPASMRTGWKSLLVTAVMFVLAGFIASNSTNDYVKGGAIGFGAYGAVKALNGVASFTPAVAGLSGFGFVMPEGIRSIAAKIVPNLGEAPISTNDLQIFGPGAQIAAEEATYEILGAEEYAKNIAGEYQEVSGLESAYQNAA